MLLGGFLFGPLFDPGVEESTLLRNSVNLYQSTLRYNPEDHALFIFI
jgi:hypothetical protein